MNKKTTVLLILDGFGLSDKVEYNAIKQASTPNLDRIMSECPWEPGLACGLAVGLPEGQMGNSEVGHLNMGSGRVVYQELTRITKSIEDGDFFKNDAFLKAIENCKENDSAIHFFGLLSDGGVHSHNKHLYALLELARLHGLQKVYIHAFLDGRDTPPTSGAEYLNDLERVIKETETGKIATVMGRYYAMDRDKRWDRVKLAYDAMSNGKGATAASAGECIESSYKEGINDEFVLPTVITDKGQPVATINKNDSVIFFNFRPDRAREITRAFCDPDFKGFERESYFPLHYVCFTEYDSTIPNADIAFKPTSLTNTLGEYISGLGLTQLRLAETEKYAHVTFFFNGGVEKEYPGEKRILIPSPKVSTYDLQPEMSAYAVADALEESILANNYDLIIANFANCDMVGHTGVMAAAVAAVEAVDKCVGQVEKAVLESGAQMIICADHGNSDQMIDYATNVPFTAHTTNPVPFILVNHKGAKGLLKDGKLCDLAPTLLDMMNIPQPAEMTGRSLLIK